MVHQGLTSQEWARRERALRRATLADDEIGRRLAELADAWRAAEAAHFAEHAAMMAYESLWPSRDECARDAAHERWDAAGVLAAALWDHAQQLQSALGTDLRCELLATARTVFGRPAASRAKTPGGRARAMVLLWRRPDPEG